MSITFEGIGRRVCGGCLGRTEIRSSVLADFYGAGDLGQQFAPLDGMRVDGKFSLPKGVEVPRLQDRDQLRRELDLFRRRIDSSVSLQQQDLSPGDLAATVFSHLGIDPGSHWINPSGRPVPLVETGQPIAELV